MLLRGVRIPFKRAPYRQGARFVLMDLDVLMRLWKMLRKQPQAVPQTLVDDSMTVVWACVDLSLIPISEPTEPY